MHPSLQSVSGGAIRWTSHQFIATFDPWHQLGTFLPKAGFFFFFSFYDRRDVVGKKKCQNISGYEILKYCCTAEDKHASQFHGDVRLTNMSSLLSLQTSASGKRSRSCITSYYGLEILNVGRRNIWHLCGGRLCNVPDNNTRVLGICNPISKASESPQPAIFFITKFFFFSWSVSVFFFFLSKSTWADDSCTVVYLLPIWNFNHVATLLHLFKPYFYTGNAFFYLIFCKTHTFYFYCFLWLNFHHDSCAVRLTELH